MSLFTRDHEVEDPDVEHTVRIARRRFARRQWARRWLAWRRVVVAVLLLGLVVGSLWLVFSSSVLAVQGVRIEGTQVLDPRAVRRAAAVPTGTPLATVNLDAISEHEYGKEPDPKPSRWLEAARNKARQFSGRLERAPVRRAEFE